MYETTSSGLSPALLHRHILILGLVALVLRTLYLVVASAEVGFDHVWQFATDTKVYFAVADYFVTGNPQGQELILKTGPGYPLIIAAIRLVVGSSPLWPIMFNVIFGSLAPIAVYLLGYYLLNSRAVAFVAGLISCVSLTSIALSCQILTDQPYFTLHAFALLCFVLGYKTGRTRWFLAAGAIAGWGAWVRSTGEFWPWLFLFIVAIVPIQPAFVSRSQMIRRALITVLVALVMVTSWSMRNKVVYDLYAFSTNGMMVLRGYLLNMAVCKNTPGCDWTQQGLAWSIEDGDQTAPPAVSYANARARSFRILREHPDWAFRTYVRMLGENIRASNIFLERQIPALLPFARVVSSAMWKWLGYLLVLMTLSGLGMLYASKQYLATAVLGVTYFYFTFVAGLSFWQGSRLHYPAEMAWGIVVAYVIICLWHWTIERLHTARATVHN